MTMPVLISNHKKQVVVSRLQKFYSSFNQAVKFGVAENGDVNLWDNVDVASNGESMERWWKKYMAPYMQVTSTKVYNNGILNSLSDGSGFGIIATCSPEAVGNKGASVCIHVYYCTEFDKCKKNLDGSNVINSNILDGKNTFLFHIDSSNGFSAYAVGWDGTREMLLENCSASNRDYCARLIQNEGWQIPKDYPIKF